MHTIHKYTFESGKLDQEIVMPAGATVLSVQNQNEKLSMWAAVRTGARLEKRRFLIALTGGLLEGPVDDLRFIGTVQFNGGAFVCHVFEYPPR